MPGADLPLVFLERLSRSGIRYMVTGSVAAILYGEPRMTHDVDLVVDLDEGRLGEFTALFPVAEFYCPPVEVIRTEVRRAVRGHFNVIHRATGFKADIYPVGEDPLHRWAMERRHVESFKGVDIQVAPAEYVILRKLEFYREGGGERHVQDIRAMLASAGDQIDRSLLEEHIRRRGLTTVWETVLSQEHKE